MFLLLKSNLFYLKEKHWGAGETHPGAALQDILRLLTLWFNHGSAPDVEAALQEGFENVSIDTWLVVIPQVSLLPVLCCAMLQCAVLCCALLCWRQARRTAMEFLPGIGLDCSRTASAQLGHLPVLGYMIHNKVYNGSTHTPGAAGLCCKSLHHKTADCGVPPPPPPPC